MKRFFWLILIAGFVFNCAGEANTETQEQATTETETPKVEEIATIETTVLNPNLATKEELLTLAQVDENLAQQILDNRPFLNITDFAKLLTAMDETAKENFLTTCFVPLNLNTTPEEEFLMVPGVGKKMAHEFEEYRPYKKVAQFRREMGKYVEDAEIARYEKYVFVPVELNTATEEEILALPGVGSKMAHEFEEYRPYNNIEQFRREIGKYVDEKELSRLERLVYLDVAQ
ncbi:MAG: helix-hairpin-helix domain-containing protein [Bacteroidota bacterium]